MIDDEKIKQMINDAAKAAAREALDNTLTMFGFEKEKPVEIQKDLAFLRAQRQFYSDVTAHSIRAVIGAALIGIGAIIWSSLKSSGKVP